MVGNVPYGLLKARRLHADHDKVRLVFGFFLWGHEGKVKAYVVAEDAFPCVALLALCICDACEGAKIRVACEIAGVQDAKGAKADKGNTDRMCEGHGKPRIAGW